ncbi:MMPL family transporter [Actinomadura sp. 9N215]|uniref:MMPL family transporter n=1 Tax=Actinomadura sp. 9N215 TaxID=3375150 RepID=UPI00379ED535
MDLFSGFVLRHKLLVALLWLAASIAGVFATLQLGDRLSEGFDQPGQDAQLANSAIVDTYGTGGAGRPLVPVITLPGGTGPESVGKAFAAGAKAVQGRAVSFATTGDRRLVSADGRITVGLVFPKATPDAGPNAPDLSGPLTAAMRPELPPGAQLKVTGMDALEGGGSESEGPGVLVETLVGGLGALIVLAFVFGSFLALVPLLIAAASILTSFLAVYGLAGMVEVSVIVQFIVALIGLGVAIDYSLLLVTRWREEINRGASSEDAVRAAMNTSGRAVLFSGFAVAIGLVAMVVLPVPFLRSVGYGGMLIPLLSVLAVLTLLPIVLATVGERLDWPRLRKDVSAGRGWTGWARGVVRFRWVALVVSGAALAGLSLLALDLHLGKPESDAYAGSGTAAEGRAALDRSGIPSGMFTPIDVLLPGSSPDAAVEKLARVKGVWTVVDDPSLRRDGTSLVTVVPVKEGGSDEGKEVVKRLRDAVPPGARVGGATAEDIDFTDSVYGAFPLMLTIIAVFTYLFLARAFRSLILPLKAVLLNLLSVAAILGAMVLIWQRGHGSQQLWDIEPTGTITAFIPLVIFAFLYGLSMDYEVFILHRMREEYDRTGNTTEAIVEGLGRTGRLVTSAALILFLAFVSMASAPDLELKMIATGLGLGILLDATLIRALFVPALVAVMGRWNWWLPGWAARLLRVPQSVPPPPADRVPVGAGRP